MNEWTKDLGVVNRHCDKKVIQNYSNNFLPYNICVGRQIHVTEVEPVKTEHMASCWCFLLVTQWPCARPLKCLSISFFINKTRGKSTHCGNVRIVWYLFEKALRTLNPSKSRLKAERTTETYRRLQRGRWIQPWLLTKGQWIFSRVFWHTATLLHNILSVTAFTLQRSK